MRKCLNLLQWFVGRNKKPTEPSLLSIKLISDKITQKGGSVDAATLKADVRFRAESQAALSEWAELMLQMVQGWEGSQETKISTPEPLIPSKL